jgi:hypothetical protein
MTSQLTAGRTRARGKIQVKTYEPAADGESSVGPALSRIHVEEEFSGDIAGQGVVDFLQAKMSEDAASFVGIERVNGKIHGKAGTFLLQDNGTVDGSRVSGEWFVIPGSGTGDLSGLRGEGGFAAELGQGADVLLDYWFE